MATTTSDQRERREYLKTSVKLCRMISMWPRGDINPYRYWIVFVVIFFTPSTILLGMCLKIFLHYRDIDGIAEVVDYATVFMSGLFRFVYLHFTGRKYQEIVDFVHSNFVHTSFAPRNKLTMDGFVKAARFIAYSYVIVTEVWVTQMSFNPFLLYYINKGKRFENGTLVHPDQEIRMAIDVVLPFDTTTPPYNTMTNILHLTSYFSLCFIYTFTDAFWFVVLVLTMGQFELICHGLRNSAGGSSPVAGNSRDQGRDDEPDDYDPEEVDKVLVDCIKQHQLMREFVRKIEALMNPIVLVDFLHAVTSITFILLDMTIAIFSGNTIKVADMMGYLLVSLSHMFILDYFGNELVLKEQEIAAAIYEVPWYRHCKKLGTKMILMSTVARHPTRLTGGKMYSVCLEFFVATMKTIVSYFMVLLELHNET